MARFTEASKYEILYDKTSGEYDQAEVGGICTRTIRAGESLEVEAFPVIRVDAGAKREAAARKSSRWQEELNLRNVRKRVRRLAENNFTEQDMMWTGTYTYPRYDIAFANPEEIIKEMRENGCPEDDRDVRRDFKNFLRKIKRRVKQLGGDPAEVKYIYVIESTKEAREGDRACLPAHYHIHAILHAPGLGRDDLDELWGKGYSNSRRLDFSINGLEGLCKYLTKQRNCVRRWACSRNLKEPEIKKSHRKISRQRTARIAADVQHRGREILEKIYPGYRVEEVTVKYSDFVAGAYIYGRLRRIQTKQKGRR